MKIYPLCISCFENTKIHSKIIQDKFIFIFLFLSLFLSLYIFIFIVFVFLSFNSNHTYINWWRFWQISYAIKLSLSYTPNLISLSLVVSICMIDASPYLQIFVLPSSSKSHRLWLGFARRRTRWKGIANFYWTSSRQDTSFCTKACFIITSLIS